ncbi:MAG: helix-turn-helix transcriptional regulator [Anaerolineae bacterium]|nr:helix-turn-helix transcriptional regulator [Anaerolineae bacterium]
MAREYDPTELIQVLEGLLADHNESCREASLRAGLDHGAIGRYIRDRRRPSRNSLLVLADHFGINPNDLLVPAGYPAMKMFQRTPADLNGLSSDVQALVENLERIGDPVLRRRLAEAIQLLIAGYLPPEESHHPAT